ncbi:MAG TPA: hypothetical protein VIU15_03025 [Streptomyces sp.]
MSPSAVVPDATAPNSSRCSRRSPRLPPPPPWSRPWTSPSKEEAAALFRQQDAATLELRLKRERRHAAALATMGIDYPYTYDGAPFGADAFTA